MIIQIHDRPEIARPDAREIPFVDGVARYLSGLTDALRDTGHEVVHLALGRDLARAGSRDEGWLTRPCRGVRRSRALEADILDLLQDLDPGALHFHGVDFVMPPAFLQQIARRWPTVATLHDVGMFCPKRTRMRRDDSVCGLRRGAVCLATRCFRPFQGASPISELVNMALANRRIAAFSDIGRIVCPSRYIADLAQLHGMPADRMRVVPNFSRFPRRHSERPGDRQILFVGRMEREKGFELLIRTLGQLGDLRWHLTAIGAGPLRDLATERLGQGRVTLLDPVAPEALDNAYRAADLLVLPYLMPESFGMVGVEALSQGCPVIGFPVGGAGDWMTPQYGAIPVTPGDVGALANAIRDALDAPPEPSTADWPFGIAAHASRMAAIYDEARLEHG